MKAKITIKMNDGRAFEENTNTRDIYLGFVDLYVNNQLYSLCDIKELTIKTMPEDSVLVNPNADVKQVFPKGRW